MKFIYGLIILLSLSAAAQKKEVISWDEASINDKVKLTISKAEFDRRHKADSTATPMPTEICGYEDGADVEFVYYKGAKYELHNGIMKFRSIRFRGRSNWFSIDNDWFDSTTTMKSFIKTYPESGSLIEQYDSPDGEMLDMIIILPADENADYEWRFYFEDEKLHSIECWSPC